MCTLYNIKKDIIVKNHEKEANDCGMKGRHIGRHIACDILNPIIRDEISGIFRDFFFVKMSAYKFSVISTDLYITIILTWSFKERKILVVEIML